MQRSLLLFPLLLAGAISCVEDAPSDAGVLDAGSADAGDIDVDAGAGDTDAGPLAFVVHIDPALAPARSVPGDQGGAPRPLAAAEDALGNRVEFVADEVLIVEELPGQADAFLARHGGELLESLDLDDERRVVRLRVPSPDGDAARLPELIEAAVPGAHGQLSVSSEAAARLLAAIGAAGVEDDLLVMPNPIFAAGGVPERTAAEAPSSSDARYNPDPFQWPGMRRGDAQDIGVGEAWRMLALSGRDENRVKVAIVDHGFAGDGDYEGSLFLPAGSMDRPGTISCSGGGTCPWHGTSVAETAGGSIDNGRAGAGTGGQVADLVLVERFGEDFFEILRFLLITLPAAVSESSRVVNMSFGGGIPAGWYALTFGSLDVLFGTVRAGGTLLVASAGNAGMDVDHEDCFLGICWESQVQVPCENLGVLCVGGVDYDSTTRAPGSNYGSRKDSDSVDLYAPYYSWVGPDPDDDSGENTAHLIAGTSFSAPFVSGVAAMVWAADPTLSANDVEGILFNTAHGSTGEAFRRVNAHAAVRRALGGNAPPAVRIASPVDGSSHARGQVSVAFVAQVDDEEGGVALRWTSSLDGELSTSDFFSTPLLSAGEHTITLTGTDGPWTHTDTVVITITRPLPLVEITQPGTQPIYVGEEVTFAGTAYDPAELGPVPASQMSWHLGSTDVAAFATGYDATYTFTSAGTYTVLLHADVAEGASAERFLYVQPAPVNNPPAVTITNPSTANYDAGYPSTSDATGYYAEIALTGTASDAESGALVGTWSRRRYNSGESYVDFGSGNSATQRFHVDAGQPSTTWEVRFLASDGVHTREAVVRITVRQLI